MELAGDASTRRFYRITAGSRRVVLMVHPEPLGPDAPLHSNQRILKKAGVPVPRILGWDCGLGAVLVEDFGDTTLQRHLSGCTPARARPGLTKRKGRGEDPGAARRLYREACSIIIDIQKKGGPAVRPGDFAARNALDRERFLFELDHFHRHYIAGLRRMRPEGDDEGLLRAFYEDLAGRCDRLGRVYCHRDFQSRNLLVRRVGARLRLGVVDFQDARMGPYPYD
ncbi:MAG: phosphotransferase, partial [Candidatus Polarisedimenticolia bacterium]